MAKIKDLTVGKPMKLLIQFTLPILLGILFQQLYNVVDTTIVGRTLGTDALAAVGATGPVNFFIVGCCTAMCAGFAIPVAQAFGAKNETELRRYVANAVYTMALIGVTLAVVTAIFCRSILQFIKTPEDIISQSVSYIRVIFIGIPVTMTYNLAGGILRAMGDSKTPVYFLMVASLTNILLDIVFITVFHMGVMGASLATVISQCIASAGCIATMVRKFKILKMSRDDVKLRPAYMGRLVNMGVPMGLQCSITAIGNVTVQTAVNTLGTTYVAAMAAGGKLSMFLGCVFEGMGTAMATYAGQNVGARKLERVHQGLRSALILGVGYSVIAIGIILLFGKVLLSLFITGTDSAKVMELAYTHLLINGASLVTLMLVYVVRLTIQGMGFSKVAMFAGAFEMVARIAIAQLLVPLVGFVGASFAGPAAWVAADIFLIPCYFVVYKKLQKQLQAEGALQG